MKQKFRKLTFIHVSKDMPDCMKHFDNDFDGIVDATYSQMYGGDDIKSYAIYKVKDGKVVNRVSWYYESQLTELAEQDTAKAEDLIEEYNLRN